jgi:dTMP kinase
MALFVSLEGGEGSGKTTVADALAERAQRRGAEVVRTFEPGATTLGARIRQSLFHADAVLTPWTEAFLFLADRANHVDGLIRPALARGAVVICDRFTDSTTAYQAYGRGLNLELLKRLNFEATGGTTPNLTLFLDVPVALGLERARPEAFDRIGRETVDFHARVAEGFKRLAMSELERIKTVDASQPLVDVIDDAWSLLEPRLARIGYSAHA